jgi:hypothetical protein
VKYLSRMSCSGILITRSSSAVVNRGSSRDWEGHIRRKGNALIPQTAVWKKPTWRSNCGARKRRNAKQSTQAIWSRIIFASSAADAETLTVARRREMRTVLLEEEWLLVMPRV